jgi:hypothetical protein
MHLLLLTYLVGCRPLSGFVDRVDGPVAVILDSAGDAREVSRRCLPRAAREGTFLVRGRIDGRSTRQASDEVGRLLDPANRAARAGALEGGKPP